MLKTGMPKRYRITRVYTRAGDGGQTYLVGGGKVSKASLRVQAYGEVDELNAALGLARAFSPPKELEGLLAQIQNELFLVGADLAAPLEVRVPRVTPAHIQALETEIDRIQAHLPPLEEFILPSGGPVGAFLHLARTICRRAERTVVALMETEAVNPQVQVYLNRLSDLLFVLARWANALQGVPETYVRFPQKEEPHERS